MTSQVTTEKQKQAETKEKYPIINCHAHIFTGDHVPPFLAKSILIWPFYKAVNFKWVFAYFRRKYKKKYENTFAGAGNLEARTKFELEKKDKKQFFLPFIKGIAGTYLTVWAAFLMAHWFFDIPSSPAWLAKLLENATNLLQKIFFTIPQVWIQVPIVLVIFYLFKPSRRFLKALLSLGSSAFRNVPSKKIKELYERYLTIGHFAFHEKQSSTLNDLQEQYPADTGFVVLPMDMIYMDAGAPPIDYKSQMEELAQIKAHRPHIYPFVFIDPRRIKEDPSYFSYQVVNGDVVLNDCFIRSYIEGHSVKDEDGKDLGTVKFSGFKIYPALGYYPFDPLLLPVWKYAAQKGLPVLTHCVRGPMYYRGKKKEEWDYHPIFRELIKPLPKGVKDTPKDYTPILLPQKKNDEFSANFTHPMNFACLLEKVFLAEAVQIAYDTAADQQTKNNLVAMFGFTPRAGDGDPHVTTGLDDLKICFGHYGGGDEWFRYFEKDRFNHSAQVIERPDFGIDFVFKKKNKHTSSNVRSLGKPEQLWKYTDWYSIISSMMLQHDNVYADISYILHDDAAILPLLKQTLQNPGLRKKVLYGTDFYVVRNHKSDKNMLADMMGGLDVEDFDQIARCNPRAFLNLPLVKGNLCDNSA